MRSPSRRAAAAALGACGRWSAPAPGLAAAAREDSGGPPSSPESTFGVQMETPFRLALHALRRPWMA